MKLNADGTAQTVDPDGVEIPAGDETGAEEEQAALDAMETDPNAEGKPDAEGQEPGEGEEAEELPKGLPAAVQEKINKRIGKITAKQKAAEEAATAAQAELETLKTTRDETITREAFALGIHPEYATKEEVEVIKQDKELAQSEAWLFTHLDGFQGTGTPEDPQYTAEQIRARYMEVKEQRAGIQGRSREALDRAVKQQLADMRRGREIRLQEEKRKGSFTKTVAARPGVKPPPLPGGSNATRKPPVGATGKQKINFKDAFKANGSSPKALEDAYLNAI